MLLEVAVASTIGAFAVVEAERRRGQRRHAEHRGQLLARAIRQVDRDSVAFRRPHLSERRLEMDLLLLGLQTTATALTEALAAEARLGQNPSANESEPLAYLAHWQEARQGVARAQQAYEQAAEAYSEFVHSLPPPLRTRAADRAASATASGNAWRPEMLEA